MIALASKLQRGTELLKRRLIAPQADFVRYMNFAVTYYCNSRCTMCNIWERYKVEPKKAKEELSLEEIDRIFSSRHLALESISLTGGEPYLRKDFKDIVGLVLKRFPLTSITIPTDSVSPELTLKTLRKVADEYQPLPGRIYISVSLDGLKDAHDQ